MVSLILLVLRLRADADRVGYEPGIAIDLALPKPGLARDLALFPVADTAQRRGAMIRCFVGCAPDGADAESQAVLEYTLRSRCSQSIEINWMIASRDPASPFYGWDMSRWATPFSGFRWIVPALCGFEGRAIYLDSDLIVLADIAELWETPIAPGKVVVARDPTRFCVSLWDCAAARPYLMAQRLKDRADAHQRLAIWFSAHGTLVQRFDGLWNYLDTVDTAPLAEAKILHYTALDTQPHLRHALPRLAAEGRKHWYDGPRRPHPRGDIMQRFEWEFADAKEAGYTPERYAPAETFGPIAKRAMTGYRAAAR